MNQSNLMDVQTKKILLTKNGLDVMKEKLDGISHKRNGIVKRLQAVTESNNDEYDMAMTAQIYELETIEDEAGQLSQLLQNAETIVHQDNPDMVALGCRVGLKNRDKEVFYTIVCAWELDIENNKISENSILGSAVLNRKLGEVFSITTPRGNSVIYTVTSIA